MIKLDVWKELLIEIMHVILNMWLFMDMKVVKYTET